MQVSVRYFGLIAETVGMSEEILDISEDTSIGVFRDERLETFPALMNLDFKMALNNSLVEDSAIIEADAELALLPPFAGG